MNSRRSDNDNDDIADPSIAGNLITIPDLLNAALQIHYVETRYASGVRCDCILKRWISNTEIGAGMPEATQAVYAD